MDQQALLDLIRQRAAAAGVNPADYTRLVQIESTFDPNAQTGSYKGLTQLGPAEWAKYGNGGDIFDPQANLDAGLQVWKAYGSDLSNRLGRGITPAENYLAHQQGPAGAAALLQNPDKNAVDAIAPYYKNRDVAASAIKGNGGDPNGTAGQFAQMWANKFNQGGNAQAQAQAQPQTGLLSPTTGGPQGNPQNKVPDILAQTAGQNSNTPSPTSLLAPQQMGLLGMNLMAAGAPRAAPAPAPINVRRPQMFQPISFLG